MKYFLPFILLISTIASAQEQRYDSFAATTTSASGIGNITQVIPNATLTVFNQPAVGVNCAGGGCVAATTFTSRTGGTPCGGGLPLTRPTSNTCIATADASGNFGFWAAAGAYQYCIAATSFTTQCYNVILGAPLDGVNNFSNINSTLYVGGTTYPTLASAIAACPSSGCNIIDNFTEAWTTNPFASALPGTQVFLGQGTWTTTISLTIPTKVRIYGSGRGDTGSDGTTIEAISGFPSSTPVIQYGTAGNATRVANLKIDCNNQTGAIGLQNKLAQEQSGAEHLLIMNCPAISLDIETSSAQNSGPFWDMEMLNTSACTNCNASTVPLVLKNLGSFRGVHGATINVQGTGTLPNALATIDSTGVSIEDIQLESTNVGDGLLLGSVASVDSAFLKNVGCFQLVNCIHISNLQTVGTVSAFAVGAGATNLIKDDTTGKIVTFAAQPTGKVSYYLLGEGTLGANAPVFTDALGVLNTMKLAQAGTSQKAETGTADANVLTLTPAATAATYRACFVASVSSATGGTIAWTLSWTDSNGTAQSNIAQDLFQDGTAAPATTFTTSAAGNYHFCRELDVNNAAANIVVKWVGGGTTAAKVSATIERII